MAGDLYIEDIVTSSLEICGGQKVYARQLNTENSDLDIKIWNDGLLWLMGYKIEKGWSGLVNITNGTFELLGTFAYSIAKSHPQVTPAFSIVDSKVSLAGFHEYNADENPFWKLVYEVRGKDERMLTNNSVTNGLEHSHNGCSWSLYSAWDGK